MDTTDGEDDMQTPLTDVYMSLVYSWRSLITVMATYHVCAVAVFVVVVVVVVFVFVVGVGVGVGVGVVCGCICLL